VAEKHHWRQAQLLAQLRDRVREPVNRVLARQRPGTAKAGQVHGNDPPPLGERGDVFQPVLPPAAEPVRQDEDVAASVMPGSVVQVVQPGTSHRQVVLVPGRSTSRQVILAGRP